MEDATYGDCKRLKDLNKRCLKEVEQFFVNYNRVRGKKFKLLGLHGQSKAETLAQDGIDAYAKRHHKRTRAGSASRGKIKKR